MASPRHWFRLKRRPCFECGDEGTILRYPWIELMLTIDIAFDDEDDDPFSSGDEFRTLCPYCQLEPFDDDYDARFPDA
jgi:hypothetical protein